MRFSPGNVLLLGPCHMTKFVFQNVNHFSKRDSYFSKGFHLFEFKNIYFIYFVFIIEFKESKLCSNSLLNDSLSCENLQNKRYCL
jgi:hypothetical protein